MKSENKLQDIISFLGRMQKEQNIDSLHDYCGTVKRLLQEFIVDNTTTPKNSFDIWKYASCDDFRPVMNGIYYDPNNKCVVATDAHIIVSDKGLYDQSIVDKFSDKLDQNGCVTVDKYGNRIEGNFPRYKRVFVSDDDYANATKHSISVAEMSDYIKRAKAFIKVNQLGKDKTIYYKVGDAYFRADYLLLLLIATDGNVAITTIERVSGTDYRATWRDDNREILLMPCLVDEDCTVKNEEGLIINTR